jgi:argininosuccinate synthase
MARRFNKVVLAYSGGLDTSIILKWLQTGANAEVVTFTADLGQGEELGPARDKAVLLGIKPENIFVEDLRETFVGTSSFRCSAPTPFMRVSTSWGTAIARPLIAQRQIEIARQVGATAVAHGATGKGNDQVRFELGYYALEPDIEVIAPWREWDFKSRESLIRFAEDHQIPIAKDKRGEAPSRSTPISCTPLRRERIWRTSREAPSSSSAPSRPRTRRTARCHHRLRAATGGIDGAPLARGPADG